MGNVRRSLKLVSQHLIFDQPFLNNIQNFTSSVLIFIYICIIVLNVFNRRSFFKHLNLQVRFN